jgi:hypothetical protein
MGESVHDNWVYAQSADFERRRIVLHTVYPHTDPPEFTDVVFESVVVHHFEQQAMCVGPYPANVLFDVVEADPAYILREYAELLARTKKHGWPVLEYPGLDELISRLTAGGMKCFEVEGTCGLCGFVFAARMELHRRDSKASAGAGVHP